MRKHTNFCIMRIVSVAANFAAGFLLSSEKGRSTQYKAAQRIFPQAGDILSKEGRICISLHFGFNMTNVK